MFLPLILPLLFTVLVASEQITGVFTSFDSLKWENGASYPFAGPSNPSWISKLSWKIDGSLMHPGDTFTLTMPCVFKFTTSQQSVDLSSGSISFATCYFKPGDILVPTSELKCVLSSSVKESTRAHGTVSFPFTFNPGWSSLDTDLQCSDYFKGGSNTISFQDGDNVLTTQATFGKGVTTNPNDIIYSLRIIPSLNKQQQYLVAGDCPAGYTSGTLGVTIFQGTGNWDCNSVHAALTNSFNDWYYPKNAYSSSSLTTSCSSTEFMINYENIPAGYRVFLDGLVSVPVGVQFNVKYTNKYTCAGSTKSTDKSQSLKWGSYSNNVAGSNGKVVEVETQTWTGSTTQVSTKEFDQADPTITIIVEVPTSKPTSILQVPKLAPPPPLHATTTEFSCWEEDVTTTETIEGETDTILVITPCELTEESTAESPTDEYSTQVESTETTVESSEEYSTEELITTTEMIPNEFELGDGAQEMTVESTEEYSTEEPTYESTEEYSTEETTYESTEECSTETYESTEEYSTEETTYESTQEYSTEETTYESTEEYSTEETTYESTEEYSTETYESKEEYSTEETTYESTEGYSTEEPSYESTEEYSTKETTDQSSTDETTHEITSELTGETTSEETEEPAHESTEEYSTEDAIQQSSTEQTSEEETHQSSTEDATTETIHESTDIPLPDAIAEATHQSSTDEMSRETTEEYSTNKTTTETTEESSTEEIAHQSSDEEITTETAEEDSTKQATHQSSAEETTEESTTETTEDSTTETTQESTTEAIEDSTTETTEESSTEETTQDTILQQSTEEYSTEEPTDGTTTEMSRESTEEYSTQEAIHQSSAEETSTEPSSIEEADKEATKGTTHETTENINDSTETPTQESTEESKTDSTIKESIDKPSTEFLSIEQYTEPTGEPSTENSSTGKSTQNSSEISPTTESSTISVTIETGNETPYTTVLTIETIYTTIIPGKPSYTTVVTTTIAYTTTISASVSPINTATGIPRTNSAQTESDNVGTTNGISSAIVNPPQPSAYESGQRTSTSIIAGGSHSQEEYLDSDSGNSEARIEGVGARESGIVGEKGVTGTGGITNNTGYGAPIVTPFAGIGSSIGVSNFLFVLAIILLV
ncbi:Agglutinin-like protein 1 [Spathaspora sp. JA1]|nr:Agglutinin-like protein 1 [Spathaspora sp. JA1]